jgi:hypothetical protein
MLLPQMTVLPYWTGIATLAAAALAALLSGTSLFLTGRREDKRWKREVLRETMESLFDSSFNSHVETALADPPSLQDLDWYKDRALDAHAVQMDALTRLRFLAKPKVLRSAFDLHTIEDKLYSAVFHKNVSPADLVLLKACHQEARTNLFNACRRDLGLRRTDEVDREEGEVAQGLKPKKPRWEESKEEMLANPNLKELLGPTGLEVVRHEMKRQRLTPKLRKRRTNPPSRKHRGSSQALKVRERRAPTGQATTEPPTRTTAPVGLP